MDHCLRHMEEPSTGECRSCHGTYCSRCLVYSFGPKKPPFCVGCALVASGVRSGSRPLVHAAPAHSAAPTTFAAAPALYSDDTSGRGPSEPPAPMGGGGASPQAVRSSWSTRRAQRQASKASRRQAQALASTTVADQGPLEAQNLEPMLSASQRQALGRLSASSF